MQIRKQTFELLQMLLFSVWPVVMFWEKEADLLGFLSQMLLPSYLPVEIHMPGSTLQ